MTVKPSRFCYGVKVLKRLKKRGLEILLLVGTMGRNRLFTYEQNGKRVDVKMEEDYSSSIW